MVFTPNIPIVTDRQIKDLTDYALTVNPATVETSGIVEAFASIGRLLVAGIEVPADVRDWIERIPLPRILFTEIACESVNANANFIMAKHVERSLYALTALRWTRCPL